LRCTYDPATRGGNAPDDRKVKATLHWVSASAAVPATAHLYSPLFSQPDPPAKDLGSELNPQSVEILTDARIEPGLAQNFGEPVQFERQGYFCHDPDSTPARPVFNRTVGLRDSYAKVAGAS
jgi:glutaminyl-tRNA synthetase